MTGFTPSHEQQLLEMYKIWSRQRVSRSEPKFEQMWRTNCPTQEMPDNLLLFYFEELERLVQRLPKDARCLLQVPDVDKFVQNKMKQVKPREWWEPAATKLSIFDDLKQWLIQQDNIPLQLKSFRLSGEQKVDDGGEAFAFYRFSMTVIGGTFKAKLTAVPIGSLYCEPFHFIQFPFKQQQEEVARQLTLAAAQQMGLNMQIIEEISCLVCYAALAFSTHYCLKDMTLTRIRLEFQPLPEWFKDL